MPATKIQVARGATIGIGDFEFARVDISVEWKLEPGQVVSHATEELSVIVSELLEEEVAKIDNRARNTKPTNRFTGTKEN